MKFKVPVKQFISFTLALILCMGPVIPVRASQSNIISSITVTLPGMDGLTVTMTHVFDHYLAENPVSDGGSFLFQTSGSISFSQDVTLALPMSFEHLDLRAGEVFRFNQYLSEDFIRLHRVNQEWFAPNYTFITDYHSGSIEEMLRDGSDWGDFVGAHRQRVPLSQLVAGATVHAAPPAPPQTPPPTISPPATPPTQTDFPADEILAFIRIGNGARPFYAPPPVGRDRASGTFNGSNNQRMLARQAQGFTHGTDREMQSHYYHAILNMLREGEFLDILPSIGLELTGTLPAVGSNHFSLDEIVMLMMLRGGAERSRNNNMVIAIDQLLTNHTDPATLEQMIDALESLGQHIFDEARSKGVDMALEFVFGAKAAKILGPAIAINNFLLRQSRNAVLRMDAVQDIRIIVWEIWDDSANAVLSGNFTDEDLLIAYNMFMLSRYLIIEQIGLAKPVLDDASNFGEAINTGIDFIRNHGRTESRWGRNPWLQDDLHNAEHMSTPEIYHDYFREFHRHERTIRFYNDGRYYSIDTRWSITRGSYSIARDTIATFHTGQLGVVYTIAPDGNALTIRADRVPVTYPRVRGLPLSQASIHGGTGTGVVIGGAGGMGGQTALRLSIGNTTYTQNGVSHQMDAAPFIVNGRTMVPLALVASALGAATSWDGGTRTVTIVKEDTTLRLTVDVPLPNNMGTPIIVNGRTFVPVAYISQMLGANVRWDGSTQAVYIQQ